MRPSANPFSSFDVTEDQHRFDLGGGYDVRFYKNHAASVPSEADACEVGNSMYSLARFQRAEDNRRPWSKAVEFVHAMERAWEVGRQDMQRDYRELMGIKADD
ncbi:hypothetical protein GOB57_23890 [Sinorhizobium meliloti]|nr:hypothetical protein [Sinorhizobium meliloti]